MIARESYFIGSDRPGLVGRYGYDELLPVIPHTVVDADGKVLLDTWEPTEPTREQIVIAARRARQAFGDAAYRLRVAHENDRRLTRQIDAEITRQMTDYSLAFFDPFGPSIPMEIHAEAIGAVRQILEIMRDRKSMSWTTKHWSFLVEVDADYHPLVNMQVNAKSGVLLTSNPELVKAIRTHFYETGLTPVSSECDTQYSLTFGPIPGVIK
jgi:hypothetical protein